MNKHAVIQQYFSAWNTRNADKLTELFAENSSLIDWEIDVAGRDNVIAANANIWEAVPDIHVLVQKIATDDSTGTGYGIITVTSKEQNLHLPVLDVFVFDDNNKITRVSAYKQQ